MKKFEITKEQIVNLTEFRYSQSDLTNRLKYWFPQAFEKELEVGKWYVIKNNIRNWLMNYQGKKSVCYGFNTNKTWGNKYVMDGTDGWIPATPQEVETALKAEAVKRGYKEGVYFLDVVFGNLQKCKGKIKICDTMNKGNFGLQFGECNGLIMKDGKWATIIETITKAEAEKLLNKKICN